MAGALRSALYAVALRVPLVSRLILATQPYRSGLGSSKGSLPCAPDILRLKCSSEEPKYREPSEVYTRDQYHAPEHLRCWFEPQQAGTVGEDIKEAVGALPHVAKTLVQMSKQFLLMDDF